jgi:hypothetical protein
LIDVPPETFFELFDFLADFFFFFAFAFAAGRFDDGCDELGLDGTGAEEVDELELDDVVLVVVLVVEVVVVVEPDGQTSDTPNTCNPAGINDDNGVPNGTVNTSPPTTCTRRTHPAAPTVGAQAAKPTTAKLADIKANSFRLLNATCSLSPAAHYEPMNLNIPRPQIHVNAR